MPQSIAAFEECIEFHPLDGATFQARIDCAKAYWQQGDTGHAEQLLRVNITGSTLKPASPEWKDSLFQLGTLLHEQNKYEEAIDTLENAVERYPDDPQRLVAQYMIGESYRRWAQDFLTDARRNTTASEHDKIMQEATKRLNTAYNHFEDVQRSITFKTHDIHSDPLMGTMLRNWTIVYFGNLIGSLGLIVLVFFSHHLDMNDGRIGLSVLNTAAGKIRPDMVTLFFKGILWVVNLVEGFSPIDSLSTGRSITWGQLGLAGLMNVLVLGGVIGGALRLVRGYFSGL